MKSRGNYKCKGIEIAYVLSVKISSKWEFDKVKARLVADGRDQDANLYPDKSLPTVMLHSVFIVLGLRAMKKWRKVVKLNV